MDFKLLKGALCATISPWDSGIGSRAQKQSSLFISWKPSEQVSQSEPMTNGCRRKAREHKGLGLCISVGMERCNTFTKHAAAEVLFSYETKLIPHKQSSLALTLVSLLCQKCICSAIITLRRCHFLHSLANRTPDQAKKAQCPSPRSSAGSEGWSSWMRKRSVRCYGHRTRKASV